MKIEKPNWNDFIKTGFLLNKDQKEGLDFWFQENVEPVNSMIEEGVEMLGDAEDFSCGSWVRRNGQASTDRTHSGLLINIQEIKPKTTSQKIGDAISEALGEIHAQIQFYDSYGQKANKRFTDRIEEIVVSKFKRLLQDDNDE